MAQASTLCPLPRSGPTTTSSALVSEGRAIFKWCDLCARCWSAHLRHARQGFARALDEDSRIAHNIKRHPAVAIISA